jgi:threonyl-tRNA synthetase
LGRFWKGPFLESQKEGACFSLFGDLAQFVALILEKTQGNLPFWMCPEQVRLLPLENVDYREVSQILEECRIRSQIDKDKSPLKEKIHRALRVKVPYVMVFGKQEEKAGNMKIRAYGSSHDQTLTKEQVKNFLVERQVESQ